MQKINVKELLRLQRDGLSVRPLHFILGNKNLEKIGEIVNIPIDTVTYHPQFNGSDELDFTVYKKKDEKIERYWDKIVDFKSLYIKEYNEWFEITVTVDESEAETKKIVKGVSLCEAELSQIILHDIEINTEDDIAREEYTEPTIIWDENRPERSLLHRIFEKTPNYTIKHVDSTLKDIQRSFSIDGTSVYDFCTSTLSQEIGCIFIFDSNERGVYVYDAETCCLDCDYRSEDSFNECPICHSTNIKASYGKDTSILIDKSNLGVGITLTSNTDSVKNCFRVVGGDELINATIKNVNPNGSNYFYYFNEDMMNDMPQELQNKITSYNEMLAEYSTNKTFLIESSLVEQYNEIISYIRTYYADTKYNEIQSSYKGWDNIISVYYDSIDLYSYLNSSMMPTWKQQDKTAKSQLALITTANLSPVSVTDVSNISIFTANNAVLAMAKALVDTSIYKVEIVDKSSSLTSQIWKGKFKLTNYSNSDDTAENDNYISVEINDDFISYTNQRVDKIMAKINDQGLIDIYKIDDLNKFKTELHKYSAQRLVSYESAFQSAIDILIQQGIASNSSDLHDSVYLPYYNKLTAIQSELSYRNTQIDTINAVQKYLTDMIDKVHSNTDFQNYIGTDVWKVFVSYRREDDYSNDNYISDGLTNKEIVQKVNELITVAKKELIKSGEKQYTISGSIQNLLLILDKNGNRVFEPILNDFTLGNFIRTKIDGKIYVMRLSDITINYSDLSNLSVTFSDVYKIGSPTVNKVSEILSKAQSMSSSYSTTIKQAEQGEKANSTFSKIQEEGLNSALYNIRNSNSTAVFDEHGILIRSYDDILDDYTDEQLRETHNEIVFTTDKWKSATTAIGKQRYTFNGITYEEYGVNSQFVIAGKIISGDIYSGNYITDSNGVCTSGTHFDLNNGDFDIASGKLSYRNKDNKLTLKGVSIDWTTSSAPSTSDISGIENYPTKAEISLSYVKKDDSGQIISMINAAADEINISASGGVNISGNRFSLSSQYTTITKDGAITCNKLTANDAIFNNATITGLNATNVSAEGSFTCTGKGVDSYGTTYTMVGTFIGGELKITNKTNGAYSFIQGHMMGFQDLSTTACVYMGLTTSAGNKGAYLTLSDQGGRSIINFDAASWRVNFGNPDDPTIGSGRRYVDTTIHTNLDTGYQFKVNNKEEVYYSNYDICLWGSTYIRYSLTVGGTINGSLATDSDKNVKKDISKLDIDETAKFVYGLTPSEFRYVNGNRLHHGFIAQEVKQNMGDNDWGLFIDKSINTSNYNDQMVYSATGESKTEKTAKYSLRYEELIADLVATCQSLNKRLIELENEIKRKE